MGEYAYKITVLGNIAIVHTNIVIYFFIIIVV